MFLIFVQSFTTINEISSCCQKYLLGFLQYYQQTVRLFLNFFVEGLLTLSFSLLYPAMLRTILAHFKDQNAIPHNFLYVYYATLFYGKDEEKVFPLMIKRRHIMPYRKIVQVLKSKSTVLKSHIIYKYSQNPRRYFRLS